MKPSRRKFLNLGIWTFIAGLGGWKTAKAAKKVVAGKSVKMMTADGKVVEVDEKFLPDKVKRKPITNEQLQSWMDDRKDQIK